MILDILPHASGRKVFAMSVQREPTMVRRRVAWAQLPWNTNIAGSPVSSKVRPHSPQRLRARG